MSSPISNFNPADMGPVAGAKTAVVQDDNGTIQDAAVAIDPRMQAEAISQKPELKAPVEIEASKGIGALDALFSFVKKIGKAACLIGGFGCSTAAVFSVFFLNVKTLGLLFGVPALLFFYVATNLGREDKARHAEGQNLDPVQAVTELLNNQENYLRENPARVIQVINSVDDMPKNKPEYFHLIDRLEALREAVLVEKAQLFNSEDEQSLMYRGQMDDYLNVLNQVLPEARSSSNTTSIEDHQKEIQARMNRALHADQAK